MRVDMDTCEEILVTITRNKTRSLLTAFGVFWGIFMLVALMGGGQGMQEMMQAEFEGFATNSGFMASQKTGEAYKGFRKGRYWDIENADIERIRKKVKDIDVITPSIARWGSTAIYGEKKYDCSVKGLYPDYAKIENQDMAYGRFINDVDVREGRKVCVIGKRVYESLFNPGEDPCGKYVQGRRHLLSGDRHVCVRRKHEHPGPGFGSRCATFQYDAASLQHGKTYRRDMLYRETGEKGKRP